MEAEEGKRERKREETETQKGREGRERKERYWERQKERGREKTTRTLDGKEECGMALGKTKV